MYIKTVSWSEDEPGFIKCYGYKVELKNDLKLRREVTQENSEKQELVFFKIRVVGTYILDFGEKINQWHYSILKLLLKPESIQESLLEDKSSQLGRLVMRNPMTLPDRLQGKYWTSIIKDPFGPLASFFQSTGILPYGYLKVNMKRKDFVRENDLENVNAFTIEDACGGTHADPRNAFLFFDKSLDNPLSSPRELLFEAKIIACHNLNTLWDLTQKRFITRLIVNSWPFDGEPYKTKIANCVPQGYKEKTPYLEILNLENFFQRWQVKRPNHLVGVKELYRYFVSSGLETKIKSLANMLGMTMSQVLNLSREKFAERVLFMVDPIWFKCQSTIPQCVKSEIETLLKQSTF